MSKRLLAIILAVAIVISIAPITVFAASSLDALKAQVPASAVEFKTDGISGNGLNGPNTIWWDYNPETHSGDVYLLVASTSAGKVANGAMLGSAVGVRLDSYAPGGNATAYTLLKFTGVWLNGDEILQVDMGNGYNTGQAIKGKVSDYFPQLKNITYWDGDDWLGADTQLSGTTVEVWDISYLPDPPTGFEFLGWAYNDGDEEPDFEAGDYITIGDYDIDLYAVWGKDLSQTRPLTYTVKYTRDDVEVTADTYTVTVPVWINEPANFAVSVAAISAANDRYIGYKLEDAAFVAPATAQDGDVITVPYVKDDSQTRDVTYTVKYTRDDVEVTTDTYTVTVPVWINEPADVAVPVAAISAANNRYVGYKLASDPFVAPATAQNGDVITVPYVKDASQTRDVTYTVKYTRDGVEVTADTYTVTKQVWILDPANVTVPVDAISAANNRYVGYKLANDPFVAPATAQDGDIITVVYVKDDSQTRNVVYTVKYTRDGVEVTADTYTVTVPVWINEPANFAVSVATISAANDRYIGYKLANDPFVAPATAQNGDTITVPYIKDDSQTRDVTYTVKYTRDGVEVTADTYTVTVPVWINDPTDVAVPVATISAANNRYVGYKLFVNPFVAPATAQNGDVITVPYVKDASQTRDVVYTVKYTRDGVEVTADTYTVTVPVWINDPTDVAVPVATISAANNRYVGYKLFVNPFVAPATARNGDVITVPYVKDASQTRDVVYTVKYTRDGVEVTADTYTVTVPVWINDPTDVAVPVAAISAANNRYVGYKLSVNPFVAPATAQNGDVITVPYVKDASQTRDVVYTVKYTRDGVEVTADTYTVTKQVWILDPANVTVEVDEISAANDRYIGYELANNPFIAPATAQNGAEITVPYIIRTDLSYTVMYLDNEDKETKLLEDKLVENRTYNETYSEHAEDIDGYEYDEESKSVTITVNEEDNVITFYYTAIVYNITYILNGGTNHPGNPTTYTIKDEITLGAPTRKNYIFLGWSPDGGIIPVGSTGDKEFTATWKATNNEDGNNDVLDPGGLDVSGGSANGSTGDGNGGTAVNGNETGTGSGATPPANGKVTVSFVNWDGKVLKTQTINVGANATAPSNPSRTGYKFTGWDNVFTKVQSNLTVTAQFDINKYTVTFKNGYDSKDAGTQVIVEYGKGVDAADVPVLARAGYTFTGWDKAITNITANTTVTAKWAAISWIVKFDPDNGAAVTEQKVSTGAKASAPSKNPTKTGYSFLGWFLDGAAKAFDFKNTAISGDITLVAKWSIESYSITFNSNSGSSVAKQTVVFGGLVSKPADPTRQNYTFGGWYTDSKLTAAYDFGTPVTKAVTLYAKWTK